MKPYDDPEIAPDDVIIRRISPHYVVPDQNRGGLRISTAAFSPSNGEDGGMSVDIEKLILAAGLDPREFVASPEFTGAVSFTAEAVRSLGLRIGLEPLETNPYHGEVWGPEERPSRFTKGEKRRLLEMCEESVRSSVYR